MNGGIINSITRLHLVGYFYRDILFNLILTQSNLRDTSLCVNLNLNFILAPHANLTVSHAI
jgi:hypothetical protein